MTHLHVIAGVQATPARPCVRSVAPGVIVEALRRGWDDFWSMPSHLAFLCLIYPVAGLCLAALTSGRDELFLIYPLISGFALIGPFAAIGVYELSRRREAGLTSTWTDAFEAFRSPAIPSIFALGGLLAAILVAWLAAAAGLYQWLYGNALQPSLGALIGDTLTTTRGWQLILAGNAVGFIFAVVALSISVVSFPLLLDRDVGAGVAVATSVRATLKNPGVVALWGLTVAVCLAAALSLAFAGLIIALPVLGHASWHLYRAMIGPDKAPA